MRLLLHVFRKDVRHFYPEILVNFALLAAFAWVAPSMWGLPAPDGLHIAAALLRVLIPLAWLVLISRVLHDEALVGDRQFWITRPYPWQMLLAEKVCFLLVFLQLPFLLMQCVLLKRAGFDVLPLLGKLLGMQLMVIGVVLLPLMAITSVTASFGRQVLTMLAGVVYLAVAYGLYAWVAGTRMLAPYTPQVIWSVVILALAVLVVWMYARRPVRESRIALLCLPFAAAILVLCMPTRSLIKRVYASSAPTDSLVFLDDAKHQTANTGEPLVTSGRVIMQIPVEIRMQSREQEATIHGTQLTLTGTDGKSWTSSYQDGPAYMHSDNPDVLQVPVPKSVYDQFASQPVTLELHAATERFAFPAPTSLVVPDPGSFVAPNGARCSFVLESDDLVCLYALRTKPPVTFALELQNDPCDSSAERQIVHRSTDGALTALVPGFDPINAEAVRLSKESEDSPKLTIRYVCPGAHVSVATEQMIGREELVMTVPQVSLPLYVARHHSSSMVRQGRQPHRGED